MAGIEWLVMLAMIALNSVFAGYEIALASIGLGTLHTLDKARRAGAPAALRMKTNMEASLAVVQLGITLVGVIAAATGGAGAEEAIEPLLLERGFSPLTAQILAISFVVVPLTLLTIVFGELIPKIFALRNKEWVCLRLSPIIEWFSLSVWPIVWFLERTVTLLMRLGERRSGVKTSEQQKANEATLQELRAVASLARTTLMIGGKEEAIILNAARLASTKVSSIQLPAVNINMLSADNSLSDCLIAAHQDMHTRFPVTEDLSDPQKIIGYVNFKDVVSMLKLSPQEPNLRGILRPLPRFSGETSVAHCLEKLTQERVHIALVVDDAGKITGMFTLEDVLEELIGEIHDEYDHLPSHITSSGKSWVVGGQASLQRIRERTGIELPRGSGGDSEVSLSDWVEQRMARPVRGGEIVQAEGVRVLVRKVRRHKALECSITKM